MHGYEVGGDALLARRDERRRDPAAHAATAGREQGRRGTVSYRAWRRLLAPCQYSRTGQHASRVAA